MEMPKRYDPAEAEPRWQEFWERERIYRHEPTRESFTIDTPPPTVSGKMHIGHASSYSQQDFYARYFRMKTGKVFFPFGTDDNGLATERLVERTKGVKATKMTRKEFRELCLATVRELKPDFVSDWKRIGMSCDFETTYSTIDAACQKASQKSFLDLYKKGHVYRQESPVSWCPACETAIAQAEFENVDLKSSFNEIAFSHKGERLVIATTRPELIPACVALAVHPEDERYKHLHAKHAKVPLFDHEVPIIQDEKVDREKGTGLMMVCTFGDKEDVEKWHKHSLPIRIVFERDGRMGALAGRYEGATIKEARERILEDLEREGLLVSKRPITHAVNVHERCGTEIEFLKTAQWYVRILDKKEELLEAGRAIQWHPEHMRVRFEHWVENLGWDWCISRQRFYGVPFPAWHDPKTGEIILADEDRLPVDPSTDPAPREGLVPDPDVMDTWATSSMSPQIVLGWAEDSERADNLLPMSLRPQAHDIIRTWAFYTIIKGLLNSGTIPWKNIAISGFVTDPHGKKMSKSKGNVVDPRTVLEQFSADAIRYWAAGAKLGDDIPYQEKDLVTAKKTATKLWNASRFAIMNLEGYSGFEGDLELMDRWLLSKYSGLVLSATQAFERFDHSKAKFEIDQFFWNDLCDNYLEIAKGRLYEPEDPAHKASAQFALLQALEGTLKLFAPFLPFITEEIYSHLPSEGKAKSIHVSPWPLARAEWHDEAAQAVGDDIVRVVAEVRKWKSASQLSMRAQVPRLAVTSPHDLGPARADLLRVTNAEELVLEKGDFSVEIG